MDNEIPKEVLIQVKIVFLINIYVTNLNVVLEKVVFKKIIEIPKEVSVLVVLV